MFLLGMWLPRTKLGAANKDDEKNGRRGTPGSACLFGNEFCLWVKAGILGSNPDCAISTLVCCLTLLTPSVFLCKWG